MNRFHLRASGAVATVTTAVLVFSVAASADAAPWKPRPAPYPSPSAKATPSPSAPTPSATATAAVTLAAGSVTPSTITAGDGAVQTIRLTGPAPAGGIDVSVTASDVIYTASVGAAVHVPEGATSVSFPFRMSAPSSTVVRSLWAQIAGSPLTKVAEVTVLAADPATRAVASLGLSAPAAVAGASVTGTVTLNNPAPEGGISVSLWSNSSYGAGVSVPPYVVVPAGSTSVTFPATGRADAPAIVAPSAHLGTSSAAARLVVVPATFALGNGFAPPGAAGEIAVGIGTAPNPSGTTITLTTDTPGVTVPATVFIPAGSPGVAFPFSVAASLPPGGTAKVTATWNGVSVSASLYLT